MRYDFSYSRHDDVVKSSSVSGTSNDTKSEAGNAGEVLVCRATPVPICAAWYATRKCHLVRDMKASPEFYRAHLHPCQSTSVSPQSAHARRCHDEDVGLDLRGADFWRTIRVCIRFGFVHASRSGRVEHAGIRRAAPTLAHALARTSTFSGRHGSLVPPNSRRSTYPTPGPGASRPHV